MSENEAKRKKIKISIDSLVLTRDILEKIAAAIDKNNPRFELNYLYIDSTNCVATNTRIMTIFEHGQNINGCFFVHGELISKALKERKTKEFILSHNKIECQKEKDYNNIFSLEEHELHAYVKYEMVLKHETPQELPFYYKENITGILLREDILINPKYIPDFSEGIIKIKDSKSPICIEDGEYKIKTIIMPIVDVFSHYKEV
ncbi:hypothetical protein CRV02_01055 [Arcobacter sp. CECT 8989]|uniref:hypothetical protein n=1 Tax=Arcobacter sp. CECT 8989 TaxID=2044509 RepID=UPI00100A42F9|nr:hypothetical protein [Arcobacter sp. CECT 8989]RXK03814.1 hypothetical protein CRV02_01055 [Arcobacter sp. CECT 8989]